ncbi:DUF6090 family protein [Winogradskyella sp. A3E31]|uniref:DUF6090 family protein n=1 Tax=Winogradskyella sp. A3E31 TaxID=3349637 RepID=UPI00398AA405
MSKNKSGRYFKYAIGEIILVVIGILIALQINNWNENRKTKKEELIVLKQMQLGFKSNLKQLRQKIDIRNQQFAAIDSLFMMIDNNELRSVKKFNRLLTTTMTYTTFDPYNNDFSNSTNLKIIQNDSLKTYLSSWTSDLVQVTEEEQNWKSHREQFYIPFIFEHYQLRTARNESYERRFSQSFLIDNRANEISNIGESKHPIDIENILDHPEFEDHLSRAHFVLRITNLQSKILEERIEKILELLQSEIKLNEND